MENQVAVVASTFPQLVGFATNILMAIVPFLMMGALFFYFLNSGISMFKDGAEGKSEMKAQLFWGALILFCMVSVWGLVGFVQNTFFSLR